MAETKYEVTYIIRPDLDEAARPNWLNVLTIF